MTQLGYGMNKIQGTGYVQFGEMEEGTRDIRERNRRMTVELNFYT